MKAGKIVLLSGGLDSATVLASAVLDDHPCVCLSFYYGQRHHYEMAAAKWIAEYYGVTHEFVKLTIPAWHTEGASSLTFSGMDVPTGCEEIGQSVPNTFVPGRNLVFLSIAVATAGVYGATDILIGANAIDYSGYPDCRPSFLNAFGLAAGLALDTATLKVCFPLLSFSKADIVRKGIELEVPYHLTWSCYNPVDSADANIPILACGDCDSCRLRLKGFKEAGERDPLAYVQTDYVQAMDCSS